MNIDTRIYGYIGDGYIVCNECAESIALDSANQHTDDDEGEITEASAANYEDAGLRPLGAYSGLHDRPCGETCECGAIIVEEDDEHGIGEACSACGYEVPRLWAVVTADHRRIVLSRWQTQTEAEDVAWELVYGDGGEDGERLPGPLTVVETSDDLYPGVGGRIPIPGETPLPFADAIEVDHLTVEQLDTALHALRNV